jgi:hypothetical protein
MNKLHFGERLALLAYSTNRYKIYNTFFREGARIVQDDSKVDAGLIKEILLTSLISTQATGKLSQFSTTTEERITFRVDYALPSEVLAERIRLFESNEFFREPAFFSASDFKESAYFVPAGVEEQSSLPKRVYTVVIGEGAAIDSYSLFPHEKERLFHLGSTFAPLAYKENNDAHYFVYKLVRALGALPKEEKIHEKPPAVTPTRYNLFASSEEVSLPSEAPTVPGTKPRKA